MYLGQKMSLDQLQDECARLDNENNQDKYSLGCQ